LSGRTCNAIHNRLGLLLVFDTQIVSRRQFLGRYSELGVDLSPFQVALRLGRELGALRFAIIFGTVLGEVKPVLHLFVDVALQVRSEQHLLLQEMLQSGLAAHTADLSPSFPHVDGLLDEASSSCVQERDVNSRCDQEVNDEPEHHCETTSASEHSQH